MKSRAITNCHKRMTSADVLQSPVAIVDEMLSTHLPIDSIEDDSSEVREEPVESVPKKATGNRRASERTKRKTRSYSPDNSKTLPKNTKRRKSSTSKRSSSTAPTRTCDLLPNGEPFSCELCKSPYVTNPLAKGVKKNKRSRHMPYPRKHRNENTGRDMMLCNACGLSITKPARPTKVKVLPTEEEKQEYLQQSKEFVSSLVELFNEPEAERLYCPVSQVKLCGCLQKYIKGTEANKEEMSRRVLELVDYIKEAGVLRQQKVYSNQDNRASSSNKSKKCRNIGFGNGHKKSKQFEEFVLRKRDFLKSVLKLCERATQKILLYSNNFLHKKRKTEESSCRVVRTKGKAALGLLPSFDDFSTHRCCIDRCVLISQTHRTLLETWRMRAMSGQAEARLVIAEMLTPAGGTRVNCYHFITMVTGCSAGTISQVNNQMKATGGNRQPPVHGLKKTWQDHHGNRPTSQAVPAKEMMKKKSDTPSMATGVHQSAAVCQTSLGSAVSGQGQGSTVSDHGSVTVNVQTVTLDPQQTGVQPPTFTNLSNAQYEMLRQQIVQQQQRIVHQQSQLQQQQVILEQQLLQQTLIQQQQQQQQQHQHQQQFSLQQGNQQQQFYQQQKQISHNAQQHTQHSTQHNNQQQHSTQQHTQQQHTQQHTHQDTQQHIQQHNTQQQHTLQKQQHTQQHNTQQQHVQQETQKHTKQQHSTQQQQHIQQHNNQQQQHIQQQQIQQDTQKHTQQHNTRQHSQQQHKTQQHIQQHTQHQHIPMQHNSHHTTQQQLYLQQQHTSQTPQQQQQQQQLQQQTQDQQHHLHNNQCEQQQHELQEEQQVAEEQNDTGSMVQMQQLLCPSFEAQTSADMVSAKNLPLSSHPPAHNSSSLDYLPVHIQPVLNNIILPQEATTVSCIQPLQNQIPVRLPINRFHLVENHLQLGVNQLQVVSNQNGGGIKNSQMKPSHQLQLEANPAPLSNNSQLVQLSLPAGNQLILQNSNQELTNAGGGRLVQQGQRQNFVQVKNRTENRKDHSRITAPNFTQLQILNALNQQIQEAEGQSQGGTQFRIVQANGAQTGSAGNHLQIGASGCEIGDQSILQMQLSNLEKNQGASNTITYTLQPQNSSELSGTVSVSLTPGLVSQLPMEQVSANSASLAGSLQVNQAAAVVGSDASREAYEGQLNQTSSSAVIQNQFYTRENNSLQTLTGAAVGVNIHLHDDAVTTSEADDTSMTAMADTCVIESNNVHVHSSVLQDSRLEASEDDRCSIADQRLQMDVVADQEDDSSNINIRTSNPQSRNVSAAFTSNLQTSQVLLNTHVEPSLTGLVDPHRSEQVSANVTLPMSRHNNNNHSGSGHQSHSAHTLTSYEGARQNATPSTILVNVTTKNSGIGRSVTTKDKIQMESPANQRGNISGANKKKRGRAKIGKGISKSKMANRKRSSVAENVSSESFSQSAPVPPQAGSSDTVQVIIGNNNPVLQSILKAPPKFHNRETAVRNSLSAGHSQGTNDVVFELSSMPAQVSMDAGRESVDSVSTLTSLYHMSSSSVRVRQPMWNETTGGKNILPSSVQLGNIGNPINSEGLLFAQLPSSSSCSQSQSSVLEVEPRLVTPCSTSSSRAITVLSQSPGTVSELVHLGQPRMNSSTRLVRQPRMTIQTLTQSANSPQGVHTSLSNQPIKIQQQVGSVAGSVRFSEIHPETENNSERQFLHTNVPHLRQTSEQVLTTEGNHTGILPVLSTSTNHTISSDLSKTLSLDTATSIPNTITNIPASMSPFLWSSSGVSMNINSPSFVQPTYSSSSSQAYVALTSKGQQLHVSPQSLAGIVPAGHGQVVMTIPVNRNTVSSVPGHANFQTVNILPESAVELQSEIQDSDKTQTSATASVISLLPSGQKAVPDNLPLPNCSSSVNCILVIPQVGGVPAGFTVPSSDWTQESHDQGEVTPTSSENQTAAGQPSNMFTGQIPIELLDSYIQQDLLVRMKNSA